MHKAKQYTLCNGCKQHIRQLLHYYTNEHEIYIHLHMVAIPVSNIVNKYFYLLLI